MVVYLDDAEPVDDEQLSLGEAHAVLIRTRAELPEACNAAHAQYLCAQIAEIEGQIAWLESEAARAELEDVAADHACDLWADYELGVPA